MENYKIRLDFKERTYDEIEVHQNDTIPIEISLYDGGVEANLTGKSISIEMKTPNDRFIIQTDNITISGNKITTILNENISKMPGNAKMNVTVINPSNNTQDSTFDLSITIHERSLDEDNIIEDDIITILSELDDKISSAIDIRNKLIQSINDGTISTIKSDIESIKNKDNIQDGRLTTIENKNSEQDTRLTDIENKNSEQDSAINSNSTNINSANDKILTKMDKSYISNQAFGTQGELWIGNIVVQWGYTEVPYFKGIGLPVPYLDNNYNVQISEYSNTDGYSQIKVTDIKTASFTINCSKSGLVYWKTIGKVSQTREQLEEE